ncbi:glutathione S-transferase family protein [Parvibaculum sp. MBR-TMA-1.3b-4.2]|jgi:glutathione S-transferase
MESDTMRLYQMQDSGNCYKPRLLAHMTGRELELVDIDILKGESRTPDFLAKNPNGRVPVLELEDGRLLAESNAMLFHLAQGTPFWPDDAFEQAQVLQWMFFEQYSHEPYIAVARYWRSIRPGGAEEARDRFPEWHDRGYQALDVMERQLAAQDWFVGTRMTIADIALYAYSHVAHEGGFSLDAYPAVRNWIARVEARPLYVPMSWRPV